METCGRDFIFRGRILIMKERRRNSAEERCITTEVNVKELNKEQGE